MNAGEKKNWDKVMDARFFAAPMVDLSHLAFRQLCRRYGARVCYTPMLHAHLFATNAVYRAENFTTCDEDRPLIVQFCANNVKKFMAAAKLVEGKCDAVDLNLGCPQLIAKRGHYGAYLQDDWELIGDMISEASRQVNLPITCKIRIHRDESRTVEYAKMLEKAGCKLLAIHGRTKDQRGHATGLADWRIIKKVVESVSIPVVANGNILNYDDVIRCLDFTNASGVMAAEGLLHNPALFSNQSPRVWKMAEEYLDLCDVFPVSPRVIRTVLFRLWAQCLPRYRDLQEKLGEANLSSTFRDICAQLELRCKEEMATLDEEPSTTSFWLCHSRPRVITDESGQALYRKSVAPENQTEVDDEKCDDEKMDDSENPPDDVISKKALRKERRFRRIVEGKKWKRKMRKEKKMERRALAEENGIGEPDVEMDPLHVSKRIKKQMLRQKLADAMTSEDSARVCIDLGFDSYMNAKELDRLAAQLRRLYGSNRASSSPLRLYFTNFDKDGELYKTCLSKNDGFDKYMVEMTRRNHVDLFSSEDLVYLTPDSPNVLESLDRNKVYIIGGLVDETVNKNCSLARAENFGVATGRFPIERHLNKGERGTYSQVLSINQVFDILLNFHSTGDWITALLTGVPRRKGFVAPSIIASNKPRA